MNKISFEFVEQRAKSDCVISSIAMFTGRSYEEVLEAAGDKYVPNEGTRDPAGVLVNLGYQDSAPWRSRENGTGRQFKTHYLVDAINPKWFCKLMWGRECMFSVPSLNIEGGWHMVYYDGHDVWDPNPTTKKRYEKLEDLEPREVYMWQVEKK
jgi:hypothetical protein